MAEESWRDRVYGETFDRVHANLAHRRKSDPSFRLEDAERVLKHLYDSEGSDWLGRGELGDAIVSAQIAAHEAFIHEWRAEIDRD